MDNVIRCSWVGDDPLYIDYHDNEWGRPVHDDNKLFEMLLLSCTQAGLSWITILRMGSIHKEATTEHQKTRQTIDGNVYKKRTPQK